MGLVTQADFNAHLQKDYHVVHQGLFGRVLGIAPAARGVGPHTHVKVDITDTPWAWADVLKAGSNLTDLATRQHAGLTDVTHSQHHNKTHALTGVTHTAAGLTIGWVIKATGATTFAWGQLPHDKLAGLTDDDHAQYYNAARHTKAVHDALGLSHDSLVDVSSNDHHPQSHTLASHSTKPHSALTDVLENQHHNKLHSMTGVQHSAAGLTIGWVLRATGTATFSWGFLTKLGTVSSGIWQGTAIANAYIAGINQNLLTNSSPTFANLNLGASPYIKWASGTLLLQTDEGTNTHTYVDVKGKGTGYGFVRIYDQDSAEHLRLTCVSGTGYIDVQGSSPSALRFQHTVPQNIQCWAGITSGNPSFYVYGYKTAVGVKYLRLRVESGGLGIIESQNEMLFYPQGTYVFAMGSDYVKSQDNIRHIYGADNDYGIGYYSATDSLQIVDGATLNSNVRAELGSSGTWYFYNDVSITGDLYLGASPLIRQASGAITFQTNEGTNTHTYLDIKGKGTGIGHLRVYDENNAEYLDLACAGGIGYLRTLGTAPSRLYIQNTTPQDIKCWSSIASGNPYFYIYGYKTGVGVKYGRHYVDTAGDYNIRAEELLVLKATGWINLTAPTYTDDNIVYSAGGGKDYSWGYHEPTDSLQIVDGATLNNNIRAKLTSGALWEFYDWVGIGKVPTCELDVNGTIKATQFYLNLGGLLDVNLGSLEEGETITYDQGTAKWIDTWGVEYDNPRLVWKMYTDFFSIANDSNDPWVGGTVNGGTHITVTATGNHPGIVQFRSTTSANSGYYFSTATSCILIAGREHSEFVFKTAPVLTNVRGRLGFQDSIGATIGYDAVYLDMSGTTLTGKTRSNNSGSTTGTSYTLSVNTWYRGKIAVNDDATLVTFFLYSEAGTQLWSNTLSTNIPTAANRVLGHGAIAWSVSTSIIALIDLDMMVASRAGAITR